MVINSTIFWEAFHPALQKSHAQVSQRFLRHAIECAIIGLGLTNRNQRALTNLSYLNCYSSGKILSCCVFSYLELHYYSHWSYGELCISSTAASCLVIIIFLEASVTYLVMQKTIIL